MRLQASSSEMRVVVDTGIILAAFMNKEGSPRQVINLWIDKKYELVTSDWQLEEIKEASRYERVKERTTPHEIGTFINRLNRLAIVLDDIPDVDYSPDPNDNPILATAIAGKAFYLVSGDKKDLVALERVEGIEILTPAQFVELF